MVGTEHPDYVATLTMIAQCHARQGECDKAVQLLKQCKATSEKLHGSDSLPHARAARNLALAYYKGRKYAVAIPLFKKAISVEQTLLSEEHVLSSGTHIRLARCLTTVNKHSDAIECCQQYRKRCCAVLGPHHSKTLDVEKYLAKALRKAGKHDVASAQFERCIGLIGAVHSKDHPDFLNFLDEFAEVLELSCRFEAAITQRRRCLRLRESMQQSCTGKYAAGLHRIGVCLQELGRYHESCDALQRCRVLQRRLPGIDFDVTLGTLEELHKTHVLGDIKDGHIGILKELL